MIAKASSSEFCSPMVICARREQGAAPGCAWRPPAIGRDPCSTQARPPQGRPPQGRTVPMVTMGTSMSLLPSFFVGTRGADAPAGAPPSTPVNMAAVTVDCRCSAAFIGPNVHGECHRHRRAGQLASGLRCSEGSSHDPVDPRRAHSNGFNCTTSPSHARSFAAGRANGDHGGRVSQQPAGPYGRRLGDRCGSDTEICA